MFHQPLTIINYAKFAVRVYDYVVPRWNNLAVLFFRCVPRWCDVGLGALKNNQHINASIFPNWVRPRDVPHQCAVNIIRVAFVVNHQRDMIANESAFARVNDRSKRMISHYLVYDINAGFSKLSWIVHKTF